MLSRPFMAIAYAAIICLGMKLPAFAQVEHTEASRIALLERADRSVVQILAPKKVPNFMRDLDPDDVFAQFFNNAESFDPESGVALPSPLGSGFIIDAEKGYILTAGHIVDLGEVPFTVQLSNGTSTPAEVVGVDDTLNIAILQIQSNTLTELALAYEKPQVGQDVFILGRINALRAPFATRGMVTGFVQALEHSELPQSMLMIDATLPFASGGGPVINSEGNVIGIASAIYSHDGAQGLAFATPTYDLSPAIESLMVTAQTVDAISETTAK